MRPMPTFLLLAVHLIATPARAADAPAAPPPAPAVTAPGAWATLSAGALVPGVFNSLGVAPTPTLTVGYFVPVSSRQLGVSLSFSYAQPAMTVTNPDARLASGTYESTLTTRDFRTALGVQYHLVPTTEALSVYVGARARAHFLSNRAAGTAGTAFGDQYEQGVTFGGAPFAGLFYRLGPGLLAAELEADLAPIDHLVTGDRNVSALALHVGYGLAFEL
jgi:hypothetical protein